MGKESQVEIAGHQYRYEYVDGKTVYQGPVGSAPALFESQFLRLLGTTIPSNIAQAMEEYWKINLPIDDEEKVWDYLTRGDFDYRFLVDYAGYKDYREAKNLIGLGYRTKAMPGLDPVEEIGNTLYFSELGPRQQKKIRRAMKEAGLLKFENKVKLLFIQDGEETDTWDEHYFEDVKEAEDWVKRHPLFSERYKPRGVKVRTEDMSFHPSFALHSYYETKKKLRSKTQIHTYEILIGEGQKI